MSFKEIKELRQAGKLEEALVMANEALEIAPDDIWNKRAAAWVYYDLLKKLSQPASFEAFKENLIKINELQLPEDEKMVFDNSAWQIGSMLFGLQKQENVDYVKINELQDIIKGFHFTKPSESYTFIYKAFHKGYQNWSNYLDFADWWGFENFRKEDYLKEEFGGNSIMSIVERAYIAYSKKLLEGEPLDQFGQQRAIDQAKIREFIPKLETLIEKHHEYQYPPYFKAKLLLSLDDGENVLSSFLPFAKQKRNDFWVWELMAEIFSDDKKTQFTCYCKALSLKTPEDFLVKLRQTFAGMLVEKQMFNEAKTEIQKVISTREKHEWKLPNQISLWIAQDWYQSATSKKDNRDIYLKHLKQAEEILFQDVPSEFVVVEFVNKNKGILNFVRDKEMHGFFKYAGHIEDPQIGDVLKVRLEAGGKEGFFKVLSVERAKGAPEPEAIKKFKGKLKVIPPNNFGFVDDVFIEPNIIKNNNLISGESISGDAILSFNKKKNEWGWKSINLK